MQTLHRMVLVSLAASSALSCAVSLAGTFSANFDDNQLPPGTSIEGAAVLENATLGGVTSGVVKLTKAVNSQLGAFIIDDVDGGAPVNGFDLKFKLRVGGGSSTPADGYSVCFGSAVGGAFGEEGNGDGLIVSFDTYDNAGGEAPAVDLKWGGPANLLVSTRVPLTRIRTGNQFWDVNIHLDPDGSVDVMVHTNQIYKDFVLTGFSAITSPRYGFGARTGGLNDNHWIDDISLTTTTGPVTLAFARHPADLVALDASTVTLRSAINDPTGLTSYQWQRKAAGSENFVDIPGASSETLTTNPMTLADTGTQYRVLATGANNNATSSTATLTVISIPVPTPNVTFNFNNGQVPANTSVLGVAAVTADGGVGNSGVLRLTEAISDQRGAFVINDFNNGQNVESFVAAFKVLVGGGTTPPADGFSFSWSPTAPTAAPTTAEDGVGAGLRVAFDIFDNGGGEAPAVELRQASRILVAKKVPIEFLETGDAFASVLVRLERDGTVDVAYRGEVLIHNASFPNWTSLANGRFVFAARTGGSSENQFIDDIAISATLQAAAPTLAIALDGDNLVLSYTGSIQAADRVEGPYADVTGATSPLRVQAEGVAKFYRARGP